MDLIYNKKEDFKMENIIKYVFAKFLWLCFQFGNILSDIFLNNHITHFFITKNGNKPTTRNTFLFLFLMIMFVNLL
jgi:hypothetical protein